MACFDPLDYNVWFETYKCREYSSLGVDDMGILEIYFPWFSCKCKEDISLGLDDRGILEICLRLRYQLKLRHTSTNDSKDEKLVLLEDIVSSESVKVLVYPRYLLDLPKYIMGSLESLKLDSNLRDFLTPMIESSVMAASKSFGGKNFVVVAHVEAVNTEVIGQENPAHLYMASKLKGEVIGQETPAHLYMAPKLKAAHFYMASKLKAVHLYMASKLKAAAIGQETPAHLSMASKLKVD